MISAASSTPLSLTPANFQAIIAQMIGAAAPLLVSGGAAATTNANHAFAQFLQDVDNVNKMVTSGQMSSADGQYCIDQYKISLQSELLMVQGLGLIAVQNAINAALNVLNTVISATLAAAKLAIL
jgi:hypothetical protein